MRILLPSSLAVLAGCPYVGTGSYQEQIQDADGDGFIGQRFGGSDCDDHDPSVGDCDADGDGALALGFGDDCDDTDPAIHPGAPEVCDGLDNDCDGLIDDDDTDRVTSRTWFIDEDGDGYGGAAILACDEPLGATDAGGDCDDANANIHPGADELCDTIDRDCDGDPTADAIDRIPYYPDEDGDGHGPANTIAAGIACTPPHGMALVNDDCNDQDPRISPTNQEVCNGIDDDCDGLIDEDDPSNITTSWYLDNDGDGYGQTYAVVLQCDQPENYVQLPGDCDDSDPDVTTTRTWWEDADLDGFGNPAIAVSQCLPPVGYVSNPNDCDDSDPALQRIVTWYLDQDGDSYGATDVAVQSCTQPAGYVGQPGDCDDTNVLAAPDQPETCDGIDNDCDFLIDDEDGDILAPITWYADNDGDGFGEASTVTRACVAPANHTSVPGDCDDDNPAVHPVSAEYCNGIDDDCDGQIDDDDPSITGQPIWYVDADGDGFGDRGSIQQSCEQPPGMVTISEDCDDGDATVNPAAQEVCNGHDDDCDGLVDILDPSVTGAVPFYADWDQDGYGAGPPLGYLCNDPTNPVISLDNTDCDDTDPSVYRLRASVSNPVDLPDALRSLCDQGTLELHVPDDPLASYVFPPLVPPHTINITGIPAPDGSLPAVRVNLTTTGQKLLEVPTNADYRLSNLRLIPTGPDQTLFRIRSDARLELQDVTIEAPLSLKRIATLNRRATMVVRDVDWEDLTTSDKLFDVAEDATLSMSDVRISNLTATGTNATKSVLFADLPHRIELTRVWLQGLPTNRNRAIHVRLRAGGSAVVEQCRFEGGDGTILFKARSNLASFSVIDSDFINTGVALPALEFLDVDAELADVDAGLVSGTTFRYDTSTPPAVLLNNSTITMLGDVVAGWQGAGDAIELDPNSSLQLNDSVFLDTARPFQANAAITASNVLFEKTNFPNASEGCFFSDADPCEDQASWEARNSHWLTYHPDLDPAVWLLYPKMDFTTTPATSDSDLLIGDPIIGAPVGLTAAGTTYQSGWLLPFSEYGSSLDEVPQSWVHFMSVYAGLPDPLSMEPPPWTTTDDGDGLSPAEEYAMGTWPILADTDGDGTPDDADNDPIVP